MLNLIRKAEPKEIFKPEEEENYLSEASFINASEYFVYKGNITLLKDEIGYSRKEDKRIICRYERPEVRRKKGRPKLSMYEKEVKKLLKRYKQDGTAIDERSWKLGFAEGCLWRGSTDELGNEKE